MALALSRYGRVDLLDFDVEEPDCSNFLGIKTKRVAGVEIDNPIIDESKCIHCGKCGSFCRYNAIAVVKDRGLPSGRHNIQGKGDRRDKRR